MVVILLKQIKIQYNTHKHVSTCAAQGTSAELSQLTVLSDSTCICICLALNCKNYSISGGLPFILSYSSPVSPA